jgi:LuxR family maltose regulon positive regulatory protein
MEELTPAVPLIRTKLHRPPVTADHLHRTQLLDRLERNLQIPLTLVSAPAGYGKSTMVSCWLEACSVPSAWVSLDENDSDLHLFLSYLTAAVQTLFPAALKKTQTLLNAADLPSLPIITNTLINEIDEINKSFILVLDDCHLVKERSVYGILAGILRNPPESMHLILVSRRDPPLPLTSMRARGQVNEIRIQELRFSPAETNAFLQQVMKIQVDEKVSALIEERTEGWVTGLRLAVLTLQHRSNLDHLVAELPEDNRYVMDYMIEEVISQQPLDVQEYLLNTAILNRFCAPLCDAVCPKTIQQQSCEMDGRDFLRWLGQSNLFVIPLDDQHKWFRYHHLFQRFLKHQLKRKFCPDTINELHHRAGTWFAENGLLDEALNHILATGEIADAARLVAQHRHDLMNKEQWHRLRLWLDMLPRDTVEKDPELLISEAWLLIGWPEMAEMMGQIEALLMERTPDSGAVIRLQGELDTLRSLVSYHMAEGRQTCTFAQQALHKLSNEQNSVAGLAVMLSGLSYQMLGDLESALTIVHKALRKLKVKGSTYHARLMLTLCFMGYMEANLKDVLKSAKQCLKLGQEFKLGESIAHGHYFLGICHYDRNDLAAAENYLVPVVKGPYIVNSHNFAYSAFCLALAYQALGRPIEAQEIVDLVVNHALEIRNTSLLQTAQAFQVELALRQGHFAETHHWAKTFNPDPFSVAYRFYVPQITLAKWFLAQDSKKSQRQAADLLSRLHDFFSSSHNSNLLIKVLALQALLLDARGDKQAAMSDLARAISMAEPGGFIRIFLDLGPHMADLLLRLGKQNVAVEYVDQLLTAFRDEDMEKAKDASEFQPRPPSPMKDETEMHERLTSRELEIVALLAQRLRNKEVAEKLFISPETVKRHTANIYQKLNVKNRRQAVERARELGIV